MNQSFSLYIILLVSFILSSIMFKFKLFLIMQIIFILNYLGLVPSSWSFTSYMWGNLVLSLILWMMTFFPKYKQNNLFLSHFLPVGCPTMLWPVLIILEMISQLIRPLTLSMRLTCNIMAGHVLMSLSFTLSIWSMMSLFLLMFEMCVALIQSAVFFLLIKSYQEE